MSGVFDGFAKFTEKFSFGHFIPKCLSNATERALSYRLQYFARGLQVYIRQLRVALQGKTGDALKTEEVTNTFNLSLRSISRTFMHEHSCFVFLSAVKCLKYTNLSFVCNQNKIKVVALKITNNINVLIKVGGLSLTLSDQKIKNTCMKYYNATQQGCIKYNPSVPTLKKKVWLACCVKCK